MNWHWDSDAGVLYYPDKTVAKEFDGGASLQDAEDWVLEQVQSKEMDMAWALAMSMGRVVVGKPSDGDQK